MGGSHPTDPDRSTVDIHPACGGTNVRRRCGGVGATPTDGHRYYCADCREGFDHADQREAKSSKKAPHGAARALEQADPDDWP